MKLGIDVGSTNLKLCVLDGEQPPRAVAVAHEGDLAGALARALAELGPVDGAHTLVTGTEGRHRFDLPQVVAPEAVEAATAALGLRPRAVVSLGGEDLVAYSLDERARITGVVAGNKCASGTGEFFRQQLGRMNLEIADVDHVADGAQVLRLSARCSVFMKSDCTHRLNKGEATVGDIALSLSKVVADKVGEFLGKARVAEGLVLLVGGVAQNRFLVDFLRAAHPAVTFEVPATAPHFEAWGAALLAESRGRPLATTAGLLRAGQTLSWGHFAPLADAESRVRYMPSLRAEFDPDGDYILGVDGGSTTTKVALVHRQTHRVVASHYGRTHGNPIAAFKLCLERVVEQLGGAHPKISLAATTGSSRELLGTFLETRGVYNEIIAHTVGTTYFEKDVDTIFEIGGQDAKYVSIHNSVPIDYAMNEACSAGTGSFLEESARGDLNIDRAEDIGPIATQAKAPLRFGQHCSAFINSDIRKAISQGAERADIVAGLVCSIVANYLNRVVGNRRIGERIALQGGVAKNPGVPLAFAQMTGKEIVVPPDPELMGCFGVAILAQRKHEEGLLPESSFDLAEVINREIAEKGTFVCKSCENLCEIRNLEVGSHKYPFGGRCSLYTNARKRKKAASTKPTDWIEERRKMLFEEFAAPAASFQARSPKVVGVPLALSTHSLWPLYSWFFHELGVRAILNDKISRVGLGKVESAYCYPAEIAHGAVDRLLEQGVDYVFLPLFRDMPSMEAEPVHACVCPLTQGLPFYLRQAFDLDDDSILRPVVSFKQGWEASRGAFADVAERLGFSRERGGAAYDRAVAEQRRFLDAYRVRGREVLAEIKANPERVYVAVHGRPYNAMTRDANMGIPRKFISQGVSVVPFDMIFVDDDEIFPNMYWYYGQMNMKAIGRAKELENLYLCWVTNFSCAPDSFMLHYLRWMMGQKPWLVLEIDSHTADAGVDTRIEAFLDIVDSYRKAALAPAPPLGARRYQIRLKKQYFDIVDNKTGAAIDVRDPRVRMVFPSMGELASAAVAASARRQGIHAVHLPVPTVRTTQLAREVASGKECIPSLLVLGSILAYIEQNPPNRADELHVFFVPSTLGPCRTGQYYVFYERLFEEMGWDNVVILVAAAENSYRELGPTFNRDVWWALNIADVMTDVRLGVRLLCADPDRAVQVFDGLWADVIASIEKSPKERDRALERAARTLAALPRRRRLEDVRKVLVVGEIYVRRDDFSIGELSDYLIAQGIFPKVTDVAEWIRYTDFSRKMEIRSRVRRRGLLRALNEHLVTDEADYLVEKTYKDWVTHKVRGLLGPTGLLPDAPHDMEEIIGMAGRHFIEPDLETEATVSSGVAAVAMGDGYSGIAVVAPFACLPGRLIEGIFGPWARRRGWPVIALESDGFPYPPGTIARMEVFAHNVLRFDGGHPHPGGTRTAREYVQD